ncbi:MAG: hypothetical protein EA425_10610 [Puniceicoccaceae bacterium]|nr:MAG: hypothetical protein EA425_10610 [Puniceicoccaceae bacterium]
MDFENFLRVERDEGRLVRTFILHSRSPAFVVEMTTDTSEPTAGKAPVIKSVRVPNSLFGDYHLYAAALCQAESFCIASAAPAGGYPHGRNR